MLFRRITPLLTTALLAFNAVADEGNEAPKPEKLFASLQTLDVSMKAPWEELERNSDYQGAYPATIEFTDNLGNKHTLEMTVERRGLTRQRVCDFPPIKMRFEKETVKGTTFRGEKSLKLVTHCNKGKIYTQYYVLEMLAYRMFNLITDFSFRVRPLSVTYVDSDDGKEDGPRFAFLIEDDGDVAKRNDQKKLDIDRTTPGRLDARLATEVALFQYMIGNLDWALTNGPEAKECCHNAKLVGQDPKVDPIYPVPYDFDSSGLVDAKYAGPPAGVPVRSVTQRLFRGFCMHNDQLPAVRQLFLEKEQAILNLVENEGQLTGSSRKKATRYLERFFDTIKDDRDFQKDIIDECRK